MDFPDRPVDGKYIGRFVKRFVAFGVNGGRAGRGGHIVLNPGTGRNGN